MRMTGISLSWRRAGDSCRNSIFGEDGKYICLFCRCHFFEFVYLLVTSLHCLRHQSTHHSMGMSGISLYWRRVGDSCRNRFFLLMVRAFVCSVAVTFCNSSTFSSLLCTALGIHERGIWWGWQGSLYIGVGLATRVAIRLLVSMVSAFGSSVVVLFCYSSTFSSILFTALGIHGRGIWWGWRGYLWIGVGLAARVTIRFFVTMVSAFVVSSVAVTFSNSYAFSWILFTALGIHGRGIWWGWQWYVWIGVGLAARVAIRFLVMMVSAFVCSVAVTFSNSYAFSSYLIHILASIKSDSDEECMDSLDFVVE